MTQLPDRDVGDAAGFGGRPVASVCPACAGLLTQDADAPVLQPSCNVGHRASAVSLAAAQGRAGRASAV